MRRMVYLSLVAAAALLPAAGVNAESAAEKAMAQQIGSRLKESGQLRNYRIGVKYQDGVAWLSGTVTSPEQRDAALRLAQQMDGVSHVVCRLEVPGEVSRGDAGHGVQTAGTIGQGDIGAAFGGSGVMQAAANTDAPAPRQFTGQSVLGTSPGRPTPARTISNTRRQPTAQQSNNMPLPMQRIGQPPRGPQGQSPIQQVSANCPPGGGMGDMGGAMGMGGGMGPGMGAGGGGPMPAGFVPAGHGGVSYDNAQMPGYAWPTYASYPNYAALTYPRQYSPTAWPYIGPFYPYPQVPLGWRRVSLEWDDGWWFLDFSHTGKNH